MQEVEIPPRDLLQHYVNCPSEKGKTLLWWFSTKRKNISFGLYYKRGKVPSASPNVFISTALDHNAPSSAAQSPSSASPNTPTHTFLVDQERLTSPSELAQSDTAVAHLRRPRAQTNPRHFSSLVTNSILSGSRSMSSLRAHLAESDNTANMSASTPQFGTAGAEHVGRRRMSHWTPKDPDMVCILPIERYDSATMTIKGSHRVQEEGGTYVLVFDNTFSRNTSKRLTFFVAMKDGVDEQQSLPELSGWLLKKKRKKMQGWAKRWFQLDKGVLSYYKDPSSYCRGSIQIAFSTVSVNPGLRLIHIDSGNMLYHLRCLNQSDFEMWKGMIRKYKSSLSGDGNQPMTDDNTMELPSANLTSDTTRSRSRSPHPIETNQQPQEHHQSGSLDSDLGGSGTFKDAQGDFGKLSGSSESYGADAARDKAFIAIANMNEQYALALEMVDKICKGNSSHESGTGSPQSPTNKVQGERSVSNSSPTSPNDLIRMSFFRKNTASNGNLRVAVAETPSTTLHTDITAAFSQLKHQQDTVAEYLRVEIERRRRVENAFRKLSNSDKLSTGVATPSRALSAPISPNSSINNSSNFVDASTFLGSPMTLSPSATFFNNRDSVLNRPDQQNRSLSRASSLNTAAEEVFFDAEEIVLEGDSSADDEGREDEDDDEEDEDDDDDSDCGESPCTPREAHQRSNPKIKAIPQKNSTEIGDTTPGSNHALTVAMRDDSASSKNQGIPLSETFSATPVFRRNFLPAPVTGGGKSILSILRKNIGKDLSTIAMPVSWNEPINFLQRLAENLEFSELLDQAARLSDDSMMRMLYVAAFVVSGFSSSRAARKPFNPLLGETYECVREDKGFRFIAEKVSHQPPVMACHAESDHWIYWTDSKVKTAFWGKSMEFSPFGTAHLVLKQTGDHYTWTNPTTWMRNMIGGNKYLEHSGESRIVNHTTGDTCVLQFKESTFFSSAKNEVSGTAIGGKKQLTVSGKWSEALFHETGPNQLSVLWKTRPPLPDAENYYGFTAFTMELNELQADLASILPHTDTRFRPDQRLFENGLAEEAEVEKRRVEEEQRTRRKERETEGTPWNPTWFEQVEDREGGGTIWAYKGGYWESRKSGKWPVVTQLW